MCAEGASKFWSIFKRQVPYHLEELRLIEVKMQGNALGKLVEVLDTKHQLTSLALVSLGLTERHLDRIVHSLSLNPQLLHLDLSWCEVRAKAFAPLISSLADN